MNRLKSRFYGIFLILAAFPMPFILRRIYPTFLYASVPSAICFWIGFLIILQPFDDDRKQNKYLRWAQYAILANILLTILQVGYVYLILFLDVHRGIGIDVMRFLGFVIAPVESIFRKIVPPPMVRLPDGSIEVTNTFIRSLLTQFFNLVLYAFAGILLKMIKDKKITTVFTGSRGPCAR